MRTSSTSLGLALLLGVAPVALCGGCSSGKKEQQRQQAEEQKVEAKAKQLAEQMVPEIEARQKADEQQAKTKAEEAERNKLLKAPADFFEVSGLKLVTGKHAVQSVSAVTITNKSHHLVSGLRARVDFMKDGDVEVSIPLQLTGTLPAGGTRTFSVDDQTLQAASVEATATEQRVIVTTAHPDGPLAAPFVPTAAAGPASVPGEAH